jgi:curved DNA-binding protein CbpA
MKDYYQILKIDESATDAQIKAAFRKLSKKFHPDANLGDVSLEANFLEIKEAYATLINNESRAHYNVQLKNHQFQVNFLNNLPQPANGLSTEFQKTLKPKGDLSRQRGAKILFYRYKTPLIFSLFFILAFLTYINTAQKEENKKNPEWEFQAPVVANRSKEDVELSLQNIKSIWKKFDGRWSGTGRQLSVKMNFSIMFDCDFEKNEFRIKYPSLGFGGSLKLLNIEDDILSFKEDLNFGMPGQMNTGKIELLVVNDNTLDYKYYFQNGIEPVAAGTLKKL